MDENNDMNTGRDPARTALRGLTMEVVGEIVLLAIVGGLFVYMFIESFSWPEGSALMPRIAIGLGTPFWIARLIVLIRSAKETSSEMIMDLGFRTGSDPRAERMRFARICFSILGLYAAIWLVGFHIAIPLWVFFYVLVYGRAGWIWSAVVGLLFLGLIVGVYDRFLNATWHDPPLLRLFWG